VLIKLNKYEDAIKTFNFAINIDPHLKKAFYNKGNALKKLNRYEEAIESYN
jgi:tetratricopeptide (TPR) repeat protein